MEQPTPPAETAEWIELRGGRVLEIRPTTEADAQPLCDFYGRLSLEDRNRRFFTAFQPRLAWCRTWASVAERGGYGVVAVAHDGDEETLIAEAGYSLQRDGDGELAVTVAPEWRGWLGGYLVDVLVRHAASRGIDNLQADVLLTNRPMVAILRHRGAVSLGHDNGSVRLTIGTSGDVPSWPPRAEGHRVLVAARGGRWSGEDAAADAGCVTAVCAGPGARRRSGCPVLEGERCPLADGAEAIVVLLDPDDERTQRLVEIHRRQRPGTPLFVAPRAITAGAAPADCLEISTSDDETVAHILSLVGPRLEEGTAPTLSDPNTATVD